MVVVFTRKCQAAMEHAGFCPSFTPRSIEISALLFLPSHSSLTLLLKLLLILSLLLLAGRGPSRLFYQCLLLLLLGRKVLLLARVRMSGTRPTLDLSSSTIYVIGNI